MGEVNDVKKGSPFRALYNDSPITMYNTMKIAPELELKEIMDQENMDEDEEVKA